MSELLIADFLVFVRYLKTAPYLNFGLLLLSYLPVPTLVVAAFEISDSVHLKMCTIFVIKELKNYFQFNEKCIHVHNR